MKKQMWYIWFAAALLALSAGIYLVHYAVFQDAHHVFIYLVGDLGFLPLSVLLVTLVVDRLLSSRDRRASMEKLNMVIGAFFSEVGTELMRKLVAMDPDRESKRSAIRVTSRLDQPGLKKIKDEMSRFEFTVEPDAGSLADVRALLVGERDFMVRLLENPLLLEHESFTDMLWATFHLTEELEGRNGFVDLPASDLSHLAGDASRVYGLLARQWLSYMTHLEKAYPYLYSLAVRLNPFDPEASAIVS